jgi:predicted AAA+ superfamily ATPase
MSTSILIDPAETLRILQGFNPWWSGQAAEVPSFRRLAFSVCSKYLQDPELRRAVLLNGPRRVGKTTILNQIANDLVSEGTDPKAVLYASLDHPLLKLLSISEILRLYHENIYAVGGNVVLLLDEIQYSDDWILYLKQLVDHGPQYRILATGSAAVLHRRAVAESGTGRWIRVPVPTLSFHEFVQIQGQELPDLPKDLQPKDLFSSKQADLLNIAQRLSTLGPLFLKYLLVGGFPETARSKHDVAWCQRLLREDVVDRVLKRDMVVLFGIRNVVDLEKLFLYICLHTGGILSVKTVADALEVNQATLANHLQALEEANLIYRLPPTRLGGKGFLKARYKVYLIDAALRNAVLLRGEEVLTDPTEIGMIVETAVLRHLYAYHYRETPQISYWRDAKTGREVDLIVRGPDYLLPVEVKYRSDPSEKPGLIEFCRQENVKRAYSVTRRENDFGIELPTGLQTQILKIPAHIFTYLLGQAERLQWLG